LVLALILSVGIFETFYRPHGSAVGGGNSIPGAVDPTQTGTLMKKVNPIYPAAAKAARVQGTVVLHAIIAQDGSVESLDAVSGPDMLKGAAIEAVKQWVYKPYHVNGEPMRVDTTIRVNFQLQNSGQ
jgi:TonB family protein